jgi:hypothetical protein
MTILKAKFKMKQLYKKLVKEKSFSNSRFSKSNLTVFAIIFAAIGGYIIYSSFATGFASSIEPENGTVASPATVFNDANASGGKGAQFGSASSCSNNVSCWPNATNTGYQNAPGYPGTKGVADATKLTTASANSSTCPTTFQSHHTYSFCHYTGGMQIGSPHYPGDPDVGQHLTDVHFNGILVEDSGPTDDQPAIMMYCDSDCTLAYFTIKPLNLSAPDITTPGKHGTSYAKSYTAIMAAGWGAYYTTGHGVSLTHSDIWGWQSGIIVGSSGGKNISATPNLIQDNWLHDQGQCLEEPTCPTHADGIGMVDTGGSADYITINHNNMPFIQDNTNNIAFQEGTYDHLAVTNNLLSGDGYTVAIWDTSTNITFTGNVWTNYAQQLFRVNYGQNFWDTPGSTWAHNKFLWDPSGISPLYASGPGFGAMAQPITATDNGKCWVPPGISTTDLSTTDYKGGSC